jgi:hypothetical protein
MRIFLLSILAGVLFTCANPHEKTIITPDDPHIAYIGRFDLSDKTAPVFMYSGCAIRTVFSGTSVELLMRDDDLRNMFTVVLDDSLFVLTTNKAKHSYMVAKNLKDTVHKLEIIRRTEWHGGNTTFLGLKIDRNSKLHHPEMKSRIIEFIGDSYTCGYGNEGLSQTEDFAYETENNYLSFGAITARELDAEYVAVCRSGIGMVQGNGGNRDFIMPALYDEVIAESDLKWDYSSISPHLVVIDLIANDLSAPLDSAEFATAYYKFLQRIRNNYPEAFIVCIAGPAAPGKQWNAIRNYIGSIVTEFSRNDQHTAYFEFTPFEMHGSDWHPNVEEHQKMAEELIPYIKDLMRW